jgi:putative transposase
MGSTYLSLHYHIVFSTKERQPFIKDRWRSKMHEYLGRAVPGLGGIPECIGGFADHVHLLVGLKAMHCLADFMRELKKASSVWAADVHDRSFKWQEGYAAFTASHTHRNPLKVYISDQEEHHRTLGFVEEMTHLVEKNGIEYDPKYLV